MIIILTTCSTSAISQALIDGKSFYNKGKEIAFIEDSGDDHSMIFPWIEKYELRTETRDFDIDQQEYTFRISPSSIAKRKSRKEIFALLKHKPSLIIDEYNCDVNTRIHEDWLELIFLSNESKFLDEQIAFHNEKMVVQQNLLGTGDFDMKDYIETKSIISKKTIEINAVKSKMNGILSTYGFTGKIIDQDSFPSIESLILLIDNQLGNEDWVVAEENLELQLAQKEIDLEKAEQKQLFDFAQIRYQGPQDDLLKERISIGIGLILPTSGNRLLRIQELKIQEEELRLEKELELLKFKQELKATRNSIGILFNDYQKQLLAQSKLEKELDTINETIIKKQDFDIQSYFEIKKIKLEHQESLMSSRQEILEEILNYLERSGLLCAMGDKFYFHAS